MSKILYISCHGVLQEDERLLLTELGHEVTVVGFGQMVKPEGYDIIWFMHLPEYLVANWEYIKHKRVIFRSIGQMVPHQELMLQPLVAEGLQIVRYSPYEETIKDYAGQTALIRFYKDENIFKGWTGEKEQVINFTQSLYQRADYCGYETMMKVMEPFPHKIYGWNNEPLGQHWGGAVTVEEQVKILQQNRVFFYTGTYPASFTLSFIEAMMTGIPIVAVGDELGNGSMFPDQKTYEVTEWLELYSDNVLQLQNYIKFLFEDEEIAKEFSVVQRELAISLFGKQKIKKQWEDFLHE